MKSVAMAAVVLALAAGGAAAQEQPAAQPGAAQSGAAPAGAALPTAGQQLQGPGAASQQDCAFLETAFQEAYNGLRRQPAQGSGGGDAAMPNPELMTMYLLIQNNVIQMHTAAKCDTSRIIAIARQETSRYTADTR